MSISGRLLIQIQGGTRAEQQLDTDDELLAAYRDHFGIVLNRVPDDPGSIRSQQSFRPLKGTPPGTPTIRRIATAVRQTYHGSSPWAEFRARRDFPAAPGFVLISSDGFGARPSDR